MATELKFKNNKSLTDYMQIDCKRPPLKWAGGKRWLVPHIQDLWTANKDRRLVEPFCGGLAVALGLQPTKAVINDINPHLINFYKWLKKGLVFESEMKNDSVFYYNCRKLFNELIASKKAETKKAAELFFYLNRTGYNGLCRFNRRGEFNVPFGRYSKIGYDTINFIVYREVFKNWDFSSVDFEDVQTNPDDFIYADPPYDVQFTQYSKEDFGWEDQKRLATWLSKHKGPVVVSNQKTPRIYKLYKELGFDIKILSAPRLISCTGDRTKAEEILAVKGL